MSASISISQASQQELQKKMREYAAVSKKDFAQICNDKGLDLAIKATQETDAASKDRLATMLGKLADTFSRNRKTGASRKKGIVIRDDSYAARIVNKRLRDAGKKMLFGPELTKAATKLINFVVSSAGFVKSTWLRCALKMSVYGKGKRPSKIEKLYGKEKARIEPAKPGLRPECLIVAQFEETIGAQVANDGLGKGAQKAIADMDVYIERKLAESAKKL